MVRRLAIAALPVVAAALVLTLALGTRGHPKRAPADPANAQAGRGRAAAKRAPAAHGGTTKLPPAPAQIRGAAARRTPIPILEYHVVGTPQPGTPNLQLWVKPEVFASEMHALRRAGYWAITMAQAWAAWTRGGPLPAKPVVLSFDDGYAADYTHVRPVLERLGWPGVLNLELNDVGPKNLLASQVRGLIRAGWEIDSHTVSHPDLTMVDAQRLRYELTASKELLRRRFGVDAHFFCYPAGRFNAVVESAVRAAGYDAATTEIEGYATPANPYALDRVRVNGSDTAASLLARLTAERPRS